MKLFWIFIELNCGVVQIGCLSITGKFIPMSRITLIESSVKHRTFVTIPLTLDISSRFELYSFLVLEIVCLTKCHPLKSSNSKKMIYIYRCFFTKTIFRQHLVTKFCSNIKYTLNIWRKIQANINWINLLRRILLNLFQFHSDYVDNWVSFA